MFVDTGHELVRLKTLHMMQSAGDDSIPPAENGGGSESGQREAKAEFAQLQKLFREPLPPESDELNSPASAERWQRSNLVLAFLEKHRADLRGIDFEGKDVDEMIAACKAQRKEVEEKRQAAEEAQGALYHAAADRAGANTEMQIALFEWMEELEELSEEEVDAWSIEKRNHRTDLILQWRKSGREECLAQLAIEVRRELESR